MQMTIDDNDNIYHGYDIILEPNGFYTVQLVWEIIADELATIDEAKAEIDTHRAVNNFQ